MATDLDGAYLTKPQLWGEVRREWGTCDAFPSVYRFVEQVIKRRNLFCANKRGPHRRCRFVWRVLWICSCCQQAIVNVSLHQGVGKRAVVRQYPALVACAAAAEQHAKRRIDQKRNRGHGLHGVHSLVQLFQQICAFFVVRSARCQQPVHL